MKFNKVQEVNKGSIKYRFDLEFENWGITIKKCSYFESPKGKGVLFPSEKYVKDGETKYYPLVFVTEEQKKEINKRAIEYFERIMKSENLF